MKQELPNPPGWANYFLAWFCSEHLLEEIQGDLYEAYYQRRSAVGKQKADWLFVVDVFQFFKPFVFEKYSRTKQFLPMLDNYFKIALRNIWHRKSFTAINMTGLSVGVAALVLIVYYLRYELNYDQSIPQYEQVYRLQNGYRDQVYSCMSLVNDNDTTTENGKQLLEQLERYDEVQTACHFVTTQSAIGGGGAYFINVDDNQFEVSNLLVTNTGESFQEVFPQAFLLGDPTSAFQAMNTIVLSEKTARKWFGTDWQKRRLLGKTLQLEEDLLTLTGVVKDVPGNTHYDFEAIIHQKEVPSWGAYTYVKLDSKAGIDRVLAQLNEDIELVYPNYWEDGLAKGVSAVALADIHFNEHTLYEIKPIANRTYLRTFGWVGLIILLIIWINYTNLSVAMYADRQRELGMRKVLGARARDISLQLLLEAVSLAILCFPIVLLLVWSCFPFFNELMGMELDRTLLFRPVNLLALLGLLLLTGLMSGAYPAATYGQRSTLHLFGKELPFFAKFRRFNFRNSLLGLQFFLLVALLSMTAFIYQQMDFIRNTDLGFQQEGIIYFELDDAEKYEQLKTAFLAIPEVEAVGAGGVPGSDMYNQLTYKMENSETVFSDATEQYLSQGSIETLGLACQDCEQLLAAKERIFLINQTAAEKLAKVKNTSPEALIGEVLITEPEYENEEYGFGIPHVIDGIIDDYKYFSLKYEDQPLLLTVYRQPPWVYEAMVSAKTDDWPATLAKLETAYQQVERVRPFSYKFLEDRIRQLYQAEQRSGTLLAWLCLVAIVLAMMGLAGVVAYIAYRRQKEIGIRKVLGASVAGILLQFNKEFFQLLLIAVLLALPASLLLANNWLSAFAFRISPHPAIVLLAGSIIFLVVVLVVSIQARRAAVQSPMENLRTD